MLTRTAEYAVRATVLLARHYGQRTLRAEEIASYLGAPKNYLSKTLNTLVHSGLLLSARGPGGGFAIARNPADITIAEVVDVFDEHQPAPSRCLLRDQPCDPNHPCSAHRRWSAISTQTRKPFHETTIAQLCIGESHEVSPADHGDTTAHTSWPEQTNRTDSCP
jgi:Rrf2 family protein